MSFLEMFTRKRRGVSFYKFSRCRQGPLILNPSFAFPIDRTAYTFNNEHQQKLHVDVEGRKDD